MATSDARMPTYKERSGFWSGETLEERARAIIHPYCEKCIDCNAYTLHMGDEYYTTSDHSRTPNEPQTKVRLGPKQAFRIPAGQFAFLLTGENVQIPSDAMAFISIRTKYKSQGLINVSGFHVDPGYNDKLMFSVFNAGPSPVHLERGLDMFLIWFADLDRNSQKIRRNRPGRGTISSELIKNMDKVLSLQNISDEIDVLKKQMAIQSRLFFWAAGIASTIVLSFFFGMGFFLLRVHVQTVESALNIEHSTEVIAPLQTEKSETTSEVEALVEPLNQPALRSNQGAPQSHQIGPSQNPTK